MAVKQVLKLSCINAFLDDNKIIRRGVNALESNHVKKMDFDADLMMIKGEVLASMKNRTHSVIIELETSGEFSGGIKSASCTCPRGIKCHHIATLALFGHYHISVTDKTCSWNAPPKPKTETVQSSEDLYPRRPYIAVEGGVPEESIQKLKQNLATFGNIVGFSWLLNKEAAASRCNFPIIEEIISSKEFLEATDKVALFKAKCSINDQLIKEIAAATTGQSTNENWYLARKFRLTASNFGLILSASKRQKFPGSLFKTLLGEYNLDGIKAIQWGRTHEKEALDHLKTEYHLKIQPTGVWLTSSGLLGASPDGLIEEDEAIVEIKCPYSFRNDYLSEKLKNNKKYIIYYDDDENLVLNTEHNYYHQIQGILHILNKKQCYLCIWTLKQTIVTIIQHDESWKGNIPLLEDFYIKYYLPKLLEN